MEKVKYRPNSKIATSFLYAFIILLALNVAFLCAPLYGVEPLFKVGAILLPFTSLSLIISLWGFAAWDGKVKDSGPTRLPH